MLKYLPIFFLLPFNFLLSESYEYQYLDQLAVEAGTDKSSQFHDYMAIYADYFAKFQDKPIKFLEIGILFGNSVKVWEKYFPLAELHFIDKDTNNPNRYISSRAAYHFLDQADSQAIQQFIAQVGGNFDLIIDDGGHTMNQQITSFMELFPALKSGGIYVIEDLHTSYWKQWGGGGTNLEPKPCNQSTTEFLKKLIDEMNWTAAKTRCADFNKIPQDLMQTLNTFQSDILSMHFYKSLCFIIKR